jgi:hypothetical protein
LCIASGSGGRRWYKRRVTAWGRSGKGPAGAASRGKVKFELSVEKITFKFEGDQDTGQAVNRAMNHTLGSLMEAQNRVIEVVPYEQPRALPSVPATTAAPRRRRRRARPNRVVNGDATPPARVVPSSEPPLGKASKPRRPRSEGFRAQAYRLFAEDYFSTPRTVADIQTELVERGFTFDVKNIASELTSFTKKGFVVRKRNHDGHFAYAKGPNNDYPGSQVGS